MKFLIVVAVLLLLSGCYTTVAVVNLVRTHPPSEVMLQRLVDGRTFDIETTHGPLPSDAGFSDVMPNLSPLTHRRSRLELSTDNECDRVAAAFISLLDGSDTGRRETISPA